MRRMKKNMGGNPELQQFYQDKISVLQGRIDTLPCPDTYNAASAKLDILLDDLDATLSKHMWLTGDTYTLADVLVTCLIARVFMIGLRGRLAGHAALNAYWLSARERPSYTSANIWHRLRLTHVIKEFTGQI